MGFRTEVRKFILEQGAEKNSINILTDLVKQLRIDNKDLMDRLMALDFEKLKIYQAQDTEAPSSNFYTEFSSDEDESNAGEIL